MLVFLTPQMIKTCLYQIHQIFKILALSCSRISFLRPYCSKMLKFFNFFSFSLSQLSSLFPFSFSLSLNFTLLPLLHHHNQHLWRNADEMQMRTTSSRDRNSMDDLVFDFEIGLGFSLGFGFRIGLGFDFGIGSSTA